MNGVRARLGKQVPEPFISEEEERLVTAVIPGLMATLAKARNHGWDADRPTKTIVMQRQTLGAGTIQKVVVGREHVIANEVIRGAMQTIRSGFQCHIDGGAGAMSLLRV